MESNRKSAKNIPKMRPLASELPESRPSVLGTKDYLVRANAMCGGNVPNTPERVLCDGLSVDVED